MPDRTPAQEASDFFNSLPFEQRVKLAPLLEDYRRMGLIEATNATKAVIRKLDGRIKGIDQLRVAATDDKQGP